MCVSIQSLVPSVSFWSFLFASLVKMQTCHKGNGGRNSPACASEPVAASSIVITTLCGASHGGVPYLCWQYMWGNWDHKTSRPRKTPVTSSFSYWKQIFCSHLQPRRLDKIYGLEIVLYSYYQQGVMFYLFFQKCIVYFFRPPGGTRPHNAERQACAMWHVSCRPSGLKDATKKTTRNIPFALIKVWLPCKPNISAYFIHPWP